MVHDLKIKECYFEAVDSGEKNFEIRNNNDRGFQKGDLVILRETQDSAMALIYTGRKKQIKITYVTNYMQKDGYVVFGFICID